jgi:hypothetical protein
MATLTENKTDRTLDHLAKLTALVESLRDDGYASIRFSYGDLTLDFAEFQRLFHKCTVNRSETENYEHFSRTYEGVKICSSRPLERKPNTVEL